MGTYFNDDGFNLQYDFTLPQRQPETVAWMECYLDERPDGVVIFHCDSGSLLGAPPYYVPVPYQDEYERLAGAVRGRLVRDGYPARRLSWALPGMGKPTLGQDAAVYMTCGALPLLSELPTGSSICTMEPDTMLDIGLILIEEILAYAHTDGLRPCEWWQKVKGEV
jgi:hypothetical protein